MSDAQYTVSELIDLALGTSKINFIILNTICHIFAKELDLDKLHIKLPNLFQQIKNKPSDNDDTGLCVKNEHKQKEQQQQQHNQLYADQLSNNYNDDYDIDGILQNEKSPVKTKIRLQEQKQQLDVNTKKIDKLEKTVQELQSAINNPNTIKRPLWFFKDINKNPSKIIQDETKAFDTTNKQNLQSIHVSNNFDSEMKITKDHVENLLHCDSSTSDFEDFKMHALKEEFVLLENQVNNINCCMQDNENLLFDLNQRFENLMSKKTGNNTCDNNEEGISNLCCEILKIKRDIKLLKEDDSYEKLNERLEAVQEQFDSQIHQIHKKFNNFKNETDNLLNEKVNITEFNEKINKKVDNETIEEKAEQFNNRLCFLRRNLKALDEKFVTLQKIVDTKAGKDEFILQNDTNENKMNHIIRTINELSKFHEGATGSRMKFTSNNKCLSCNRDVVMKVEENDFLPKFEYVCKPKKIIMEKQHTKALLKTKLDNIRKDKFYNPNGINMNHLETMYKTISKKYKHKNISNRYHSGSEKVVKFREHGLNNTQSFLKESNYSLKYETCQCK